MTTTSPVQNVQPHGLRRFVRRHPYLAFILAFNVLGQIVAFVPVIIHQLDLGAEPDLDLFLIVPTLLFLLVPALVITYIARGPSALHRLVRSMIRFRVRWWWYTLPLIVIPALTVVTALPPSPALTVRKVLIAYLITYLPALLFQFVTTNWWEETVWMGFFQAPLQDRFGPWRAVMITTPFFALQHISLVFGGTVRDGAVQFALILLVIVPTRALLAWVYNHTSSLAIVGLVHAASNAAGLSLVPQLFHQPGGGGSALLILGVVVIAATRGRLGRPTPRSTATSTTRTSAPGSATASAP